VNKFFEKPRTVFQEDVNTIVTDDKTKEVINDVLHLLMFKRAERDEKLLALVEIYNLLGVERFAELVDLLNGKTVTFPQREEFRETVQIALCYYERHLLGKKWNEIREILKDPELNSVRMSARTGSFQRFLEFFADRIRARRNTEEKETPSKFEDSTGCAECKINPA
jgi:hypothetical protein